MNLYDPTEPIEVPYERAARRRNTRVAVADFTACALMLGGIVVAAPFLLGACVLWLKVSAK